jgi:hypothetical protein
MGNKSAIQWPLRWGCTCSHSGKHAKPANTAITISKVCARDVGARPRRHAHAVGNNNRHNGLNSSKLRLAQIA